MNPWDVCVVTNEFYFSDWLFLYYLARNMEPYLFRQMLLEHIIPEIQSERNSMIYTHGSVDTINESEIEKLNFETVDEEHDGLSDAHSLNSIDMTNGPVSPLIAVNEKRVKFV